MLTVDYLLISLLRYIFSSQLKHIDYEFSLNRTNFSHNETLVFHKFQFLRSYKILVVFQNKEHLLARFVQYMLYRHFTTWSIVNDDYLEYLYKIQSDGTFLLIKPS